MAECKKQYIALSYSWGNPTARREIVVNGKPACVTENLYAALTHLLGFKGLLASILEECEIWVDALCINQQDAAEKLVQVASMRDVFANAHWVVAWLGLSADGSDELLQAMNDGFQQLIPADGEPQISALALHAFLAREWFGRIWILQEFMSHWWAWFVCGHSYISQYHLSKTLDEVLSYMDRASYYIVDTVLRDLLTWRMYMLLLKERFLKNREIPLMYLIEVTKDARCTDSRDRILRFLG